MAVVLFHLLSADGQLSGVSAVLEGSSVDELRYDLGLFRGDQSITVGPGDMARMHDLRSIHCPPVPAPCPGWDLLIDVLQRGRWARIVVS